MSYYNIIAQTLTTMFVRGVSEIAELHVAIRRIQEFLMNDEFVEPKQTSNNNKQLQNRMSVVLHNVTGKWNPNSTDNTLTSIDIAVQRGNLIGVIGPVGSGKSSLLQAILSKFQK